MNSERNILFVLGISSLIAYEVNLIPQMEELNYEFIYILLFSGVTLASILQTIFHKEPQKSKVSKENEHGYILIILLITAFFFYISTFLSLFFCLLLIAFHFGETDLKLKTSYIWNLVYGLGLIGMYFSNNWSIIIINLEKNQIIHSLQKFELSGINTLIKNLQIPFIITYIIGIVMSWMIRRNSILFYYLMWIPIIYFLSPIWSLLLYLFLWRPLLENLESKEIYTLNNKILFSIIGLGIGIGVHFIFFQNLFIQSLIITFIGISFIIPFVLKKHEQLKKLRRVNLYRSMILQRELNKDRLKNEYQHWEIQLLKKIETSQIVFKEPNKL